jgi:chromosome segregation ATPase
MLKVEDGPISTANQHERLEPNAAHLDAVFLSLWRRALDEGSGLELTLTEAAALLGTTTQTLRRRIQRDEIQTRRDSHGRLRVIPLLGVSAEMAADAVNDAQATVARLFEEMKRLREDLAQVQAQRDALSEELTGAREALVWAQDELASHTYGGFQNWTLGQTSDVDTQKRERVRLASKLDEARRLAGRRPWRGITVMG